MAKRSSIAIKQSILSSIQSSPLTYAQLERKVNTGFRSIKANCEELAFYGLVEIKCTKEHPANGRPSYEVNITGRGIEILKKKR